MLFAFLVLRFCICLFYFTGDFLFVLWIVCLFILFVVYLLILLAFAILFGCWVFCRFIGINSVVLFYSFLCVRMLFVNCLFCLMLGV